MSLWVRDGYLTDHAVAFFSLAGVKVTDAHLDVVNPLTQAFMKSLRGDATERWQMPDTLVSDTKAFEELATELGLLTAQSLDDNHRGKVDLLIVPGSTVRAMRHRLLFALKQTGPTPTLKDAKPAMQLIMLTGERPLNDEEIAELSKCFLPVGATEANGADFVLFTTSMLSGMHRMVLPTPDPMPGRRASTDDTVDSLLAYIGGSDLSVLISNHQPYASRMMLVFDKMLQRSGFKGVTHYVAAPPLPQPGQVDAALDGNFISRTYDEACRLVYELSQRLHAPA